jgi:hypothetical protein
MRTPPLRERARCAQKQNRRTAMPVFVVGRTARAHAPSMFAISEAQAAAIRAVYEQCGELSAAAELRRLFPGVTDNRQARECVRTIAGWRPARRLGLPSVAPKRDTVA